MSFRKELILVVDDSTLMCKIVKNIFREINIKVIEDITGENVLDIAKMYSPDIILLDVILPKTNGFDICKQLKQDEETKDIPVLFITGREDQMAVAKAFEAGGVDYICKPFNAVELKARVISHLEIKRSHDKLKMINIELTKALEENKRLATMDKLTSLYNRYFFLQNLDKFRNKAIDENYIFSLILADIDDFKKVNDTYGHGTGDYVLTSVSEIIKQSCRQEDIVCRWGGEEFIILAKGLKALEAKTIAEKIRTNIENFEYNYEGARLKITVTLGVSEYNAMYTTEKNIDLADKALYRGKEYGKNRCIVY
jgi:diguanylate cyclase (GGDEF)-like protein